MFVLTDEETEKKTNNMTTSALYSYWAKSLYKNILHNNSTKT